MVGVYVPSAYPLKRCFVCVLTREQAVSCHCSVNCLRCLVYESRRSDITARAVYVSFQEDEELTPVVSSLPGLTLEGTFNMQ